MRAMQHFASYFTFQNNCSVTASKRRALARAIRVLLLGAVSFASGAALAAKSARAQPLDPPPVEATPPPAPPYSLPWQLRPAAIATVLRSDTAFAFYENPVSGESGSTVASMLLGSYKVTPEFAPLVRLGVVSNSPPDAGAMPAESAFNFINPVVGGTYMLKLSPDFRLALFLGLTVPIGGGGGDMPDPANAAANRAGILARSAMDNAMFAVDYFTVFPGVGLAYVNHGLTVQVEATLLQLFRVKGDAIPANDSSRTNLTAGLHVGYFFIPELSAGAELRHQRWLSTPTPIKGPQEDTLRDTSTFAIGLRAHFKLSDTMWLRPGLAYARAIDDPMDALKYNIVQLDVPLVF
jgi:hypothetical protein